MQQITDRDACRAAFGRRGRGRFSTRSDAGRQRPRMQYLESTKKNVLEATKGLSQAQWDFKPAPDRWSVAQVMEHIAASEDFIRDNLLKE